MYCYIHGSILSLTVHVGAQQELIEDVIVINMVSYFFEYVVMNVKNKSERDVSVRGDCGARRRCEEAVMAHVAPEPAC